MLLVVVFGVIISNSLFLIIINLKSNLKQYSLFGFYINIYIYISYKFVFFLVAKKKKKKLYPSHFLFIFLNVLVARLPNTY